MRGSFIAACPKVCSMEHRMEEKEKSGVEGKGGKFCVEIGLENTFPLGDSQGTLPFQRFWDKLEFKKEKNKLVLKFV